MSGGLKHNAAVSAASAPSLDMVSLSREEACRIFGLSAPALDALIAGGHVLCHISDGETRVPLDQLETFFREGLLRVYRTQAIEETVHSFEAPDPVRAPVAMPEESEDQAAVEAPVAPTLTAIPREEPPVIAAVPPPPPAPEVENDIDSEPIDLRIAPRYIPRRQINGIIDDVKFTIVQMSRTGLRIRHTEEIVHASDSKLTFALLNPARSFMMRGRVVWTSAATTDSGERKFYISGVKITEHVDRLVNAIEILTLAHDLQPDRRVSAKVFPDDELPMAGASDDEIAMVIRAVQHFAADPLDANRWYARGRFALADANVRRDAPRKPREREEVLGIWEYLERQIDMTKIGEILTWVRRNRAAGARV